MRWRRIIAGGVLLEAALLVVLLPVLVLTDNPFAPRARAPSLGPTAFFGIILLGLALISFLFGIWVARPLASGAALHGALAGTVATVIYLALCSIPPSTIATVMAGYGTVMFIVANGLRIAGAAAGAAYQRSKRTAPVTATWATQDTKTARPQRPQRSPRLVAG